MIQIQHVFHRFQLSIIVFEIKFMLTCIIHLINTLFFSQPVQHIFDSNLLI